MSVLMFVLSLAGVFSILFIWAFRHLPGERWQFVAAVPLKKNGDGTWRGLNLTYYGLFNANAYLAAVVTVFVLLGAVRVPAPAILAFTFILLAVCVPASRLVARLVEKKRFTFSVAGAAFIGLVISPWLAWLTDLVLGARLGFHLPVAAAVAAISVAYALGEGLGRLACISFGCCYGKPMAGISPLLRRMLLGRSFTFEGKTKKIAYADRMDGQKVVPVQALTAVLFTVVGLIGLYCYLKGYFLSAFLIPLFTTQTWRFLSEFLRADYRGRGSITAYQKMCLAAMLYAGIVAAAAALPSPAAPPSLSAGLAALWRPSLILFLEGLWVFSFLYTGKSQVTDAHLKFSVRLDRI
jgi:hypothetical protein